MKTPPPPTSNHVFALLAFAAAAAFGCMDRDLGDTRVAAPDAAANQSTPDAEPRAPDAVTPPGPSPVAPPDSGSGPDVAKPIDTANAVETGGIVDLASVDTAAAGVCRTDMPFLIDGKPTGFSTCDGVFRRAEKRECPSRLPRVQAPNVPGVASTCNSDADCTAKPHGHCEYSADFIGNRYACAYGCLKDEECGTGKICLCGDPVGVCVPSNCTTDASCMPGKHCSVGTSAGPNGFCGTEFACQVPADKCVKSTDCTSNRFYCGVTETGRSCVPRPEDVSCP